MDLCTFQKIGLKDLDTFRMGQSSFFHVRRVSIRPPAPPNDQAHLPGPPLRRCVARNQNAAPVRCNGWFGVICLRS